MDKVNLAQKFSLFDEYWSPKIVGELNGQYVKLAKFKGEFIWHHHKAEDELFFVIKGRLMIRLRERDVILEEGEFFYRAARGSTQARCARGSSHSPV